MRAAGAGDEMFADSYPMREIEDGFFYEVDGSVSIFTPAPSPLFGAARCVQRFMLQQCWQQCALYLAALYLAAACRACGAAVILYCVTLHQLACYSHRQK